MQRIQESFDNDELRNYLTMELVDEGVVGDFFKKTFNYLKGQIAKVGNFFVKLFNGKALPVMMPITSQIALKQGSVPDSKCIHWVGNTEDAKYSGVSTSGLEVLASRESTIEMWKRAAKNKNIGESLNEALKLASDDNQLVNVDEKGLAHQIEKVLRRGSKATPLLIWGAPGVGKTCIVNAVLNKVKGEDSRMLDMQLSMKEHDDFFLPSYDVTKSKAVDLPKSYLPVWEDIETMTDEERQAADEACGKGLIFLDELSRAKPQVQDVCLKLVNERKLGDKYKLGSGWCVIAASNRLEDDEDSQFTLSKALANRFVQVNYSPTFKSWRKWADTKGFMNQMVLDWIEQNQKFFYYQDNDETSVFCSPRSWEAACHALADEFYTANEEAFDLLALDDETIEVAMATAVGKTPAHAFMDYVKLTRSVDINKLRLVFTDPKKAPKPEKVGKVYRQDLIYIFTTMIISFLTKQPTSDEFTNLCKYYASLDDMSAAGKMFGMITKKFQDMNEEFGDIDPDKNAYQDGLNVLIKAYPDWENAKFD